MTDSEFETYLELLGRLLRLSPRQRDEISQELRDHLEQRLDELLELGHSRQAAVSIAVEELGDAGGLAANFVSITRQKRQRWAMRFATFSIVGCFVATLLIFSLWPDQGRLPLASRSAAQESSIPTAISHGDSVEARTARTRDRLEQTIVDLDIQELPLGDLLNQWRDQYEIEFYLADSSDLKSETPVTIQLRQVRLSMAIELLMGEHNSQYIVRDGLILMASVDQMAEWGLEIRVYNCRDLVDNTTSMFEYGSDPIATPGGEPGATDKEPTSGKGPSKADQLVSLIKSVVSMEQWEEVGPSIVVFDGLLVVNSAPAVHQQIEQLIAQLRKVAGQGRTATTEGPK